MLIQHYPSQQISLWSHLTKMRFCFILVFLLMFTISTSALASVINKQLHFEWTYDLVSIPEDLAGFKIYQNGQSISTVNDDTVLTLDLNVALQTDQANIFTISAFDVAGDESAQSGPYVIDLRNLSVAFPNAAISLLLLKE